MVLWIRISNICFVIHSTFKIYQNVCFEAHLNTREYEMLGTHPWNSELNEHRMQNDSSFRFPNRQTVHIYSTEHTHSLHKNMEATTHLTNILNSERNESTHTMKPSERNCTNWLVLLNATKCKNGRKSYFIHNRHSHRCKLKWTFFFFFFFIVNVFAASNWNRFRKNTMTEWKDYILFSFLFKL